MKPKVHRAVLWQLIGRTLASMGGAGAVIALGARPGGLGLALLSGAAAAAIVGVVTAPPKRRARVTAPKALRPELST